MQESAMFFSMRASDEILANRAKKSIETRAFEYLSARTYDTIWGAHLPSNIQNQMRQRVSEQAKILPKNSLKNVLTNVKAFDTMTPSNVITNVNTQFTRKALSSIFGKPSQATIP
jgi:hypothetical protein